MGFFFLSKKKKNFVFYDPFLQIPPRWQIVLLLLLNGEKMTRKFGNVTINKKIVSFGCVPQECSSTARSFRFLQQSVRVVINCYRTFTIAFGKGNFSFIDKTRFLFPIFLEKEHLYASCIKYSQEQNLNINCVPGEYFQESRVIY